MTITTTQSEILFERASKSLVGGVNSPVRAFRGVGGHPLFIDRAEGASIFDVDGNKFIDYVLSWGPGILGHAPPAVVDAIVAQASRGTSFGAPCELEIVLAERIRKFVPSLDMIRFVSSGTEATMSALRLARGFTSRDDIVKCEGCYHGHADSLLVKAGSGVSTLGLPDSPGVPADLARHTFNVPYNDLDAAAELFRERGDSIACFIVEPVAGNMGCVPPDDGYLQALKKLCEQYGALLIMDEVMTGFRVGKGGAQARYDVVADLVCYGKVIGGGLPVGAFGGRRDIMQKLAPLGPVYQAGTLSGNPLAMAAGIATLSLLDDDELYRSLADAADTVSTGIAAAARAAGYPAVATSVGSMFSVFYREAAPRNYDDVKDSDSALFRRFFWGMLDEGVYLAPSAFEAGFVSTKHTHDVVTTTVDAAKRVFARLRQESK